MKDGEVIESDEIVVNVSNPITTVKSRILAEGIHSRETDGEPVYSDVPGTVIGPFEVAFGFGYHIQSDASTTKVTGLEVADFEVTNAIVSAPE